MMYNKTKHQHSKHFCMFYLQCFDSPSPEGESIIIRGSDEKIYVIYYYMKSFRDPNYVERYEDVIFDLETALNTTVANNAYQKKDGYRFVVDNSGEVTPFDWYNARISLDFKVVQLANGGNIAVADHNGIVNGSYSLLKHFDIKLNGTKVYDCQCS